MSNTHIMLDIETLGTSPRSVIFAIGAIKIKDGEIKGEFLGYPSIESSLDIGLSIEAETLKWWMTQNDDARKQFNQNTGKLKEVLSDFSHWCGSARDLYLWGNGADFDNTHIAEAYKACGMSVPWNFWNSRCFRTLKGLFPDSKIPLKVGTKHHALNDALAQAHHLMQIFKDNELSY
jgi:DNA polymerase III epsilon subunit-like protein|tara:strand:- start:4469 stop:4999 length:531 start_codon:yes stop_codon:yes gene_type:complete